MLISGATSSNVTRTGIPMASVAGSQPTRFVSSCTPSSSSTQASTYGSSSLKPRACVRCVTVKLYTVPRPALGSHSRSSLQQLPQTPRG